MVRTSERTLLQGMR